MARCGWVSDWCHDRKKKEATRPQRLVRFAVCTEQHRVNHDPTPVSCVSLHRSRSRSSLVRNVLRGGTRCQQPTHRQSFVSSREIVS